MVVWSAYLMCEMNSAFFYLDVSYMCTNTGIYVCTCRAVARHLDTNSLARGTVLEKAKFWRNKKKIRYFKDYK